MHPPLARAILAFITAVFAVSLLGACKTVRTEKWRKGSVATSEYERRMDESVNRTYKELEALASGDESADFTHSNFDQNSNVDTKSSLFGKKEARTKTFKTNEFAGAEEYKINNYHFLKRQNFETTSSPDQDQRFNTAEATEEKRRFFNRNKVARTKDFADNNKTARTSEYRDTAIDIDRLKRTDPNIVDDAARQDGAALTVDDVRTMLHGPQ